MFLLFSGSICGRSAVLPGSYLSKSICRSFLIIRVMMGVNFRSRAFVVVAVAYVAKWVRHPQAARAELLRWWAEQPEAQQD